jgi:hypothetical protein
MLLEALEPSIMALFSLNNSYLLMFKVKALLFPTFWALLGVLVLSTSTDLFHLEPYSVTACIMFIEYQLARTRSF